LRTSIDAMRSGNRNKGGGGKGGGGGQADPLRTNYGRIR
jgi:ATP-dependent RNA helicase RhlE